MPGPIYPENTKYQALTSAVGNVGRVASAARKSSPSPKSFDTQKYNSGLSKNYTIPTDISSLGTVTTPYQGSTNYESVHPGIDVANKIGTQIPSFSGGTVIESKSGYKQGDKGFGNTVVVQDAKGNKWRYSHLNQGYVKVGQQVQPGTVIGGMGNTGSTYSLHGGTGSHLDLRIKDAYGKYLNPYSLL